MLISLDGSGDVIISICTIADEITFRKDKVLRKRRFLCIIHFILSGVLGSIARNSLKFVVSQVNLRLMTELFNFGDWIGHIVITIGGSLIVKFALREDLIGKRHKLFQLSLVALIVIIIGIIRLSIELPSYLQLSFRLEDSLLFLFIRLTKIVISVIG